MKGLRARDALVLGRVSNLPTVWTNIAAGMVLAGAPASLALFGTLALALSLSYVAGMVLNDAFDREIDARERPERPIPAGRVAPRTAFALGFGLLAAGFGAALLAGALAGTGLAVLPWAAGLAAAIVGYDLHHKGNPLSPLVMGLCRMLVYAVAAAAATGGVAAPVWIGAGALFVYLVGLTAVAKQENLRELRSQWPLALLAAPALVGLLRGFDLATNAAIALFATFAWDAVRRLRTPGARDVPGAVTRLLAGICLVDAIALAAAGAFAAAVLAVAACALTRVLQRHVPAT
jgi:4-hydroxybenzoate polyprenyltransferase